MKASHIEKYIDAVQKKKYFTYLLPVFLLITVKPNERTARWGRTADEEVIHRLEAERRRLIIGVGL